MTITYQRDVMPLLSVAKISTTISVLAGVSDLFLYGYEKDLLYQWSGLEIKIKSTIRRIWELHDELSPAMYTFHTSQQLGIISLAFAYLFAREMK